MSKTVIIVLFALTCSAQTVIPEGTKIRVRLDQPISSATAEAGATVEFSVTDAVTIGSAVAIAEGARATGTITVAQEKRRMGRAGKLDFSIDRVRAADGQWVPLRYTVNKKSGQSHAVGTGILTAGVAVVFWPAAPAFLLRKGKDITVNRGMPFDVFTDANHSMGRGGAPVSVNTTPTAAVPAAPVSEASAKIAIVSPVSGADIEVNGAFVGNTPTTITLSSGSHRVVVRQGPKSWERTLQVSDGSSITLQATPR